MKVLGRISKYGYPFQEIRIRRKKLGQWKAGDRFSVCVYRKKIVLKKEENNE